MARARIINPALLLQTAFGMLDSDVTVSVSVAEILDEIADSDMESCLNGLIIEVRTVESGQLDLLRAGSDHRYIANFAQMAAALRALVRARRQVASKKKKVLDQKMNQERTEIEEIQQALVAEAVAVSAANIALSAADDFAELFGSLGDIELSFDTIQLVMK